MTLTAERLRELLHYDPDTGVFTRLVASMAGATRNRAVARVGDIAGGADLKGYVLINVDGRKYRAHRLAWLYVHGVWPPCNIDHRNGNCGDNHIKNLRAVTQGQNMQNRRRASKNNGCGFLGVSAEGGRFRASIKAAGKKKHLGYFDTPELAHAAYLEAKARLHPFQTLVPPIQRKIDSES